VWRKNQKRLIKKKIKQQLSLNSENVEGFPLEEGEEEATAAAAAATQQMDPALNSIRRPSKSSQEEEDDDDDDDTDTDDDHQESFLTLNVRYQLALTIPLYIFNFHGIARVVYKPPTGDNSAMCQYFASNGQLLTWVMYMYMLMLSFWLLVFITCGRAMRRLPKFVRAAFEIGSHVLVWVVSLIFFIIPFFVGENGKSIYGEAGEVCWISSKTQIGKVVGMATFYVR